MMAHGGAVIEIQQGERRAGAWSPDSQYARRITLDDRDEVSGPAAGHERLKTSADPTGTKVLGTLNNCAGGKTPWGTVLMAEENFHGYFGGAAARDGAAAAETYERYGVPGGWYAWWRSGRPLRRRQGAERAEPLRLDGRVRPLRSELACPVKRTALGRLKHEGATSIVNKDGRLVALLPATTSASSISTVRLERHLRPDRRRRQSAPCSTTARSTSPSSTRTRCTWLPLVHGEGPLTAENGFASQADVLIEARAAADLVGATPMDRPEDVEPNPVNGRVYVMLTNNTRRKAEQVDGPNPRRRERAWPGASS